MSSAIVPFSDEQMRLIVNLEQQYEVWIAAERAVSAMPYGMKWKQISGREYLYEMLDRQGNGKSLGVRSSETEAIFDQYQADKEAAKARLQSSSIRLSETCRLYRTLRLPLLASEAAGILREADRREMLGSQLLVVGTNAMPAYSIEAAGRILEAPDETDDFDLAWTAMESEGTPVWSMLQAVDGTYTMNSERTFQVRNAKAHEVELLVAPSRASGMQRRDRPLPVPLEEQEWLLNGTPVSRVVVARDGSPARIVAPDPRWFALQKLWMSEQAKRNPLKRPKDAKQGIALLNTIREAMPQYPLDEAFEASLPSELVPLYEAWKMQQRTVSPPTGW